MTQTELFDYVCLRCGEYPVLHQHKSGRWICECRAKGCDSVVCGIGSNPGEAYEDFGSRGKCDCEGTGRVASYPNTPGDFSTQACQSCN